MRAVGVFEAKNRLSELIESGEVVTITRHGKPVATLTPVRSSASKMAARIREFRREGGVKVSEAAIVELTRSGRR